MNLRIKLKYDRISEMRNNHSGDYFLNRFDRIVSLDSYGGVKWCE